MVNKIGGGWKIILWLFVSLLTITCSFTSTEPWLEEEDESAGMPETISDEGNASASSERWTIDQCNAIQDATITLNDFDEHYYRLDTEENIICDYNYKVINQGTRPLRLIHYEQLFPSEEYGSPSRWVPFTIIQPEDHAFLYGFIDQCNDCIPSRHETLTYSLALVYEIPECQWITEGDNPHIDILHIAEEEPVLAPCTLLSLISYSEAVPDISAGLRP